MDTITKMSPRTELRLIKALTNSKPFIKAKDVDKAIKNANNKLLERQSQETTLKLEKELRRLEIDRCLTILDELN